MINLLSSRENPLFRRENFMDVVESNIYGAPPWIDPLSPRLMQLAQAGKVAAYHTYRGEPGTTISFKYYQTTSLAWLICMVNGFLFFEDVTYGHKLKIIDLSQVSDLLKPGQPTENMTGKVVRI